MAQKKITELQLISAVGDDLNIPGDNGIQTYRATALQFLNYIYSKLIALAAVTPVYADYLLISDASDSGNIKRALFSSVRNRPVASKTAAYTLVADDSIILADATSAAFTLTLPTAASSTDKVYTVKKIDSSTNAVTIDPSGAETIEGAATFAISVQYEAVTFVSNGTAWYILS